MFKDNDMVWPLNKIDLSSLKLLHEFEFGGIVNAKQLSAESEAKQRLQTELSVWGISLVLDEFAGFEFDLNKAKVFGVQWSPQQFLEKACAVNHPLDPVLALPSVLAETIEKHAQKKAHEITRERAEFFLHWNARAADLRKKRKLLGVKWIQKLSELCVGRRFYFLRRC